MILFPESWHQQKQKPGRLEIPERRAILRESISAEGSLEGREGAYRARLDDLSRHPQATYIVRKNQRSREYLNSIRLHDPVRR